MQKQGGLVRRLLWLSRGELMVAWVVMVKVLKSRWVLDILSRVSEKVWLMAVEWERNRNQG